MEYRKSSSLSGNQGRMVHIPRRSCRRFLVLSLAFIFTISSYFMVQSVIRSSHSNDVSLTKRGGVVRGSGRMSPSGWGLLQDAQGVNTGQTCVHPQLQLWHPALKKFFKDPGALKCSLQEENWVYATNGTFRISHSAQQKHGDILCEYIPFIRGSDDFEVIKGDPIKPMKHGDKLVSDFFNARCIGSDGAIYSNVHSGIAYSQELHKREPQNRKVPDSHRMNILMFGLDSTSRMTWMRNLPRTHDYVMSQLGATLMEGYNIVGDGTPQALLPILTGSTEAELPEARRGFNNAKCVDGHPWIWKDLVKLGYVTQWGEDGAGVGTFTYRMQGFKKQPVDHYMRTFYLEAEKLYYKNKPYCLGSVPRHLNMLNWIREFYIMYPDQPKFSFLFHSEYSHQGHSETKVMDQDLKDLLWWLEEQGFLENTLLVLMADHGARFQSMRQTEQGKYEERLPYLALRLPPSFLRKHPQVASNLKLNAHRLTTPFDLHATFHHLINFTEVAAGKPTERGISLLREVPKDRTCGDAGIEPHWCACLAWKQAQPNDPAVRRAAEELVDTINSLTADQSAVCTRLSIHNITEAVQYSTSSDVLHFKQSLDSHGRVPDLTDNMAATEVLYQVTVLTKPGLARYEGTVTYMVPQDKFVVSQKQISRTNKYGNQPHCVMKTLPHLRPYCYCMHQID